MTGGIERGGVAKMTLLDEENADFNLTTTQTVLTHTPSTTAPKRCVGVVFLGDGSKDLTAAGGNFELTVVVGSQVGEPGPQTVAFGTNARSFMETHDFVVPKNTAVQLKVKSPNGGDTDVDVTAYLYALPM